MDSSNVGVAEKNDNGAVSLREWQEWGTSSLVPVSVAKLTSDLKTLEKESGAPMVFGGLGGKLQGDFKVIEEKKHREMYQSLVESEDKLRYFSARQIACRLLGGREHLCQKCWLVKEDCMCSELVHTSLWQGIRFWLYMHPKDFLRQNNTGKLLWQVFGVEAASLCIFGIHDMEEIMWNAFKRAGKDMVWVLYPNKNAPTKCVRDIFCQPLTNAENLKSFQEYVFVTVNICIVQQSLSYVNTKYNNTVIQSSHLRM
ncbi:hypothetical protein ZOSMA_375G00190 [Zostera marina]|uniref:tRNA-uridine aminocarboxypropyltransferase n=1 Tax=Zostera marina TaxID=29655 RepID=A0A0K9P818_ZOSMR|nr:hypothetical protein ZOSMA_375G00190 [Zostera marina]